MIVKILVILLVVWKLLHRWQRRRMYAIWNQVKSNHIKLPFIGHAYMFFGGEEGRMKTFQRFGMEAVRNGGITGLWQASRLYVMIADPVDAECVLKTCLEKDDALKCMRLVFGNGNIFAPVSIWRRRRKILAPTFRPKNLIHFVSVFSKQSNVMVANLKKAAGGGTFSIWKYMTTYSMDSVCETTLGVHVNAQKQVSLPFIEAYEEIFKMESARLCQPWLHNEEIYKMTPLYKQHIGYKRTVHNFIDQIIKSKRKSLDQSHEGARQKTGLDQSPGADGLKTFLELLIDSSGGIKGYTDVELREQTLVLVLAGTDTSAVGAAFTAVMLSKHQDVQEKLYQELQEVFGDSDRPIVAEDLPRLKYLEAVIKESLRLYPPVPIILRSIDRDVQLPSGITLVKDCGVIVNIWALHRNPNFWGDDAEIFRPERFIDTPLKHPAAFMAFSYGSRGCIGYQYAMMSMKTATAALLRQYRVLPASMDDAMVKNKNKPIRVKVDIMMKAMDNFEVQLQPRLATTRL